jgi:pilus assembly protein Flp/PilA
LLQFIGSETAVSALEYAMLASLVAGVAVIGVTALGSSVSQLYDFVLDQVVNALP